MGRAFLELYATQNIVTFCFTARITLHNRWVSHKERRQAKPAGKERKAKDMGDFPEIHIIASDVYVL